MRVQAVGPTTGRPSAPMECTNAVTNSEIDALNEGGLDDAGKAMGTQLLTSVRQGTAQGTGKGDDEPTGTQHLDDLRQMQLWADLPGTRNPDAEMGGEDSVILAQSIG